MPRLKTHDSRTEEFHALSETSHAFGEDNDCAVIAVAIATGRSYLEVHALFEAAGRNGKKGTPYTITGKVLDQMGFKLTGIKPVVFIQQYPSSHHILKNVTTHHPARFNKVWKDGRTYLLCTRGHILAVKDGRVHDWSESKALRVERIILIEKKEAACSSK